MAEGYGLFLGPGNVVLGFGEEIDGLGMFFRVEVVVEMEI